MPRAGELTYYDAIGEHGLAYAIAKPFSDVDCGYNLIEAGALMALLPHTCMGSLSGRHRFSSDS